MNIGVVKQDANVQPHPAHLVYHRPRARGAARVQQHFAPFGRSEDGGVGESGGVVLVGQEDVGGHLGFVSVVGEG